MTEITLPVLACRCGHTWIPRTNARPKVCPRCKARAWDQPYKRQPAEAAKEGDHDG